jgi:hypothetical protein
MNHPILIITARPRTNTLQGILATVIDTANANVTAKNHDTVVGSQDVSRAFAEGLFRDDEQADVFEMYLSTLSQAIREDVLLLMQMGGSKGLGKNRRNQRQFLGMVLASGILHGWRSTSLGRDKMGIAECRVCGCLFEARLDNLLPAKDGQKRKRPVNTSCGCLEKKNRDAVIDAVIEALPERTKDEIAQDLAAGRGFGKVINHFGLYGWAAGFAASRIWATWTRDTWNALGSRQMFRMAAVAARNGFHKTAKAFNVTLGVIRTAMRWAKKFNEGTAPAVPVGALKVCYL